MLFAPEDRTRLLGHLNHGVELAAGSGGSRASHDRVIWRLIEEAVETMDRTPDQERRWLTSGTRSGGWNAVGLTPQEAADLERIRFLSAMKPYDGSPSVKPQRNDVERAMDVLEWLRWCDGYHEHRQLTKAAVVLARGGDSELVYRLYAPERKFTRQIIHEIRKRVCTYVLKGLATIGIVPGPKGTFQESYQ